MKKGTLFIVSGPSGAGKGTLVSLVLKHLDAIDLSVSATTRAPRTGETDGVSYRFLSDEQFDKAIADGCFLEWAHIHGARYGTLTNEVERVLASGRDLILEIDVQGGAQVRARCPDAVLIFIEPPSLEELEKRLRARNTDSDLGIKQRLAAAKLELEQKKRYNAVVVNDDLNLALKQLLDVIEGYRETNLFTIA